MGEQVKFTLAIVFVIGITVTSGKTFAASVEDLAARVDAVEKENSILREKIIRLEAKDHKSAPKAANTVTAAPSSQRTTAKADIVSKDNATGTSRAVPAGLWDNCAGARWSGAYVGLNAGGGVWTANRTDQDGLFGAGANTLVQKKADVVGGGQAGYNWTTCSAVFGIEIDGDWANTSVTTPMFVTGDNALFFPHFNVASRFGGLVTARARAGITLGDILLYATGGPAAARFRTHYCCADITGKFSPIDIVEWRWGLVVGFGAEWPWSDRVALRSELLLVDMPDRKFAAPLATLPGFRDFVHSDSMWIARAGVSVKLGEPAPGN